MRMDGVDLEGDVRSIIDQESGTLVDILCDQDCDTLRHLHAMVDYQTQERLSCLQGRREQISALVDYFKTADPFRGKKFLETICMHCENIPMLLESRLMSASVIDLVESYTTDVKSLLLKKYKRVTKDVAWEVRLDQTSIALRHKSPARGRERMDRVQVQASLDSQDGEEAAMEDKVTAESLLSTTGRVVVLLGQAGSGKTLLMHCLGQHWAQGAFPSIHLLFLFEFRQLNLVPQSLSLRELLFRFFLPPQVDDDEGQAVLNFILSNPEKICFIFDGYDEFQAKFTNPDNLSEPVDPDCRLSMAELLSGLCSRRILPNSTVLVTCRPRDVAHFFESSGCCIGELLGFDRQRVRDYANQFFKEKKHDRAEMAVNVLMESRHLLTMSFVPALCHICCICLDHLFSKNGSCQTFRLPTTLTQIYLQILSAYLSRSQGSGHAGSSASVLQQCRTHIAKLSRLALKGLEESRIVFLKDELSSELMNFGFKTGLLSQVDLTYEGGSNRQGCTFMHLTMQEFLAALYLMTSHDIVEAQLKKKLNLKTRWTTKTDPKTVFTDSVHLFVCGLAAQACHSCLIQLKAGENAKSWVQKRQAVVLKILKSIAGSTSLTGPKAVELCRCAHETQDVGLAQFFVSSRDCFELRNIRLNPLDMDALAFVTSASEQGVGLDFGGCSMELECLEILASCKNVDHLIFRSRKHDDKFAEVLAGILPKLPTLKKLKFIGGSLTDTGASSLAKALEDCPLITHFDISDNNLTDKGMKEISETLCKLKNITSVTFGKNNFSLHGVFILVEEMAQCHTAQQVQAHLTDCELRETHMERLYSKLSSYSSLISLDLSKNALGNKGLKKLLDFLPKLKTIEEINVSENGITVDGVIFLADCLHTCMDLIEVHARDLSGKTELPLHKKLSLTHSDVQSVAMTKLCRKLVKFPHLLELDFSHCSLKDDVIEKLLKNLPDMTCLQLLNLSHVQMSTDGALLLVTSLIDCQRVKSVELRPQGEAFIKFVKVKAEKATCKLSSYELSSGNVEKLSRILEKCPRLADLDLSSNLLRDEGVKSFVDFLPRLQIKHSVNLTNNELTQMGALYLVNSVSTCEKVVAVEVSLGSEDKSLIRFVQESVTSKTLSLRECRFETTHFQKLIEILSQCPKLIKLELSSNESQNEDTLYLLSGLAKLSSVQTLEMRQNRLNSAAIKELVSQMSRGHGQRNIRIEEPRIMVEDAVDLVASCLALNQNILEITVNKTTLDISFEIFLDLTASRIDPENQVSTSHALRSISFTDCELHGRELYSLESTLQRCHSLQGLHLISKEMSEDEVVIFAEGLRHAQSLESLSLTRHIISDECTSLLGRSLQSLPNLKSISLSQCSGWTTEGRRAFVTSLMQCFSLEQISLDSVELDEASLNCLATGLRRLPSVRRLSLKKSTEAPVTLEEDGAVLHLIASLQGFKGMEEIELEGMRFGQQAIEELQKHIPNWINLKKISLFGNCVSDRAGEKLVQALKHCRQLQELKLSKNRLGQACAAKLGEVLPLLHHLTVLDLSENQFNAEGALSISKSLFNMTSLTNIKLTAFGTPELGRVVSCLAHCTSLEDISLAWNGCGDAVAMTLAEILPQCTKLRRLDLESNSITTAGAKALAKCLPSCPSIEVIRLWRNNIAKDDPGLNDKRLNFSSTVFGSY
ncbi:protein NLRC5 [Chanos chanos]|uniref:Protein NLRC5 n=1 Tax=Chanos chanos TaxID=29144 RepID=A0A6J2WRK8_CHACN|nr:protein NLRC5 [Chanos chanos]